MSGAARTDGATVEALTAFLTRYYADMETNDPTRYGTYYAEDVRLVFGNDEPILGREAVTAAFDGVLSRVRSLHHDLVSVWSAPDDVVIFESVGTWHLFDGRSVSVPACSVFTVRDERFTDLNIYVDNAPVFAALDSATA